MADDIANKKKSDDYKLLLSSNQQSLRLAGEAGFVAIRSLILINGAAAIAILALFGEITPMEADVSYSTLQDLGSAAIIFAFGAALGVWAAIFMQMAIYDYVEIINEQMRQLTPENADNESGKQNLTSRLDKHRNSSWMAMSLSLFLFFIGVLVSAVALDFA